MKSLRAVLTAVAFFCVTAPALAQPYAGNIPIPGVVQAENYDNGGEGVSWHDTSAGNVFGAYRTNSDVDVGVIPSGGYHIGFVEATEWTKYTVNVATTGQYEVRLRVATAHPGPNNLHIELGGVNVSGTQTVNNNGDWNAYSIKTFNVILTAGNNQTLKVAFDSGSINLDSIEFVSSGLVQCSTSSAAPTPINVPCEFTAVGSGAPGNPYAAAMDARATMTPPPNGSLSKPVKGFWVGPAGTFKFRFTPNASGAWVANFSSTTHPTAFNGQGPRTFYIGSTVGSPGFLRRETTGGFPDRLVRDDGSHPFLWGTTYYQILNNVRALPSPSDSRHWTIALTNVKAKGVNKVRLLVYPWWGSYSGFGNDTQPYGGPRAGCTGGLSVCPDYDVLDTGHFDALDKVVDSLFANGMIADIILFKDPADDNHDNPPPPVDNYRTFGDTATQDQRLAKYVVARYAAYTNVTFCLANEWENTDYKRAGTPAKNQAYWNTMGNLVRAEDPYYYNPVTGRFRVLTIHHKTAPVPTFGWDAAVTENSGWFVSAELQYGVRSGNTKPDKWGTDILGGAVNYAGTVKSNSIPMINEEFGYLGESKWTDFGADVRKSHRQAIWGLATAGLFGTLGDTRPSPQATMSGSWTDQAEYGDLKRMVDFFTASRGIFTIGSSSYWQMRRDYAVYGNNTRRVYAFTNTGKTRIVFYDAIGGNFNVFFPAGKTYNVYSYDPSVDAAGGSLPYGNPIKSNVGGSQTINTPAGRDTVILCIAQ